MPPDFPTGDNEAAPLPLMMHQAVIESPPARSFVSPTDAAHCTEFSVCPIDAYVQAGVAPRPGGPTALTSTTSRRGAELSRRPTTWWPPISPVTPPP